MPHAPLSGPTGHGIDGLRPGHGGHVPPRSGPQMTAIVVLHQQDAGAQPRRGLAVDDIAQRLQYFGQGCAFDHQLQRLSLPRHQVLGLLEHRDVARGARDRLHLAVGADDRHEDVVVYALALRSP